MKENNYLNIELLFKDEESRSIENLKLLYNDINFIKEKIKLLIIQDINFVNSIFDKRVLLKPNWVMHALNENDNICLITNESFILAIVETLIEFKPRKITLADSPIQICNWVELISDDFFRKINILYFDIRRATYNLLDNKIDKDKIPIEDYVIFDLGINSNLEEISKSNIFRVTNYNPDKLAETHNKGIHKYCISKELFENDIIISIPKIKTHQKSGITGAIKNLVGLNGDKDYLPHHRVGGTGFGGDCYPGKNYLRRFSEYLLDIANRNIGNRKFYAFKLLSIFFWKINIKTNFHKIAAGWYGNDTVWRMVQDINFIAEYGLINGSLNNFKVRTIYSISDGIIGGQGEGPLKPDPLNLGIIAFSNNSYLNDIAMAQLMGFNFNKIPLFRNKISFRFINNSEISINRVKVNFNDLNKYKIKTIPPSGWGDKIF